MPSKRAKEAEEVQEDVNMMSDISSGTTVSRDPNDETFRLPQKGKTGHLGRKSHGKGTAKGNAKEDSELSNESDDEDFSQEDLELEKELKSKKPKGTRSRTGQIVPKKRQRSRQSKSPRQRPEGDSDGGSSGTTPVDDEDNSYRPARSHGLKRGRGKLLLNRVTGGSRASSTSTDKNPPKKKAKGNAGVPITKTTKRKSREASKVDMEDDNGPENQPAELNGQLEVGKQILGYWKTATQYFAGTIQAQVDGGFHVQFYDGAQAVLPIDKLRLFDIREGDQVRTNETDKSKHGLCKVLAAYDGDPRGVRALIDDKISYIPLANLYIPNGIVKKEWADRLVEPAHLGLSDSVDLIRSVPRSSAGLSGKIFLVTINVKDSDSTIRKALETGITSQGGKIASDWPELFEDSVDGFWSKLSTKDAPFLLVHGPEGAKPKTLAALAAGIPCISADYVAHMAHRVSRRLPMELTSRRWTGELTWSHQVGRSCMVNTPASLSIRIGARRHGIPRRRGTCGDFSEGRRCYSSSRSRTMRIT